MLLNFDQMEEQLVPNPRGGEGQMRKRAFQNEDIQIMYLHLEPHSVIGLHPHTADSEMYYIVSGRGRVLYDKEELPVQSGSCHYCPKRPRPWSGCSPSGVTPWSPSRGRPTCTSSTPALSRR